MNVLNVNSAIYVEVVLQSGGKSRQKLYILLTAQCIVYVAYKSVAEDAQLR